MATGINDMVRRLKSVSIEKEAEAAVSETKDLIGILNLSQFEQGLRADGSFLPNYSKASVEIFGKPAGPIKLFDTGDFYKALKVAVGNGVFKITNSDPKTDMLKKRYEKGDKPLFGMTTESRIEYIKTLRPEFVKNMKEKLKL